MSTITLIHDHEHGTRVEGDTSKGDGVYEILSAIPGRGWTFRSWAGIHIRGTRDKFVHRAHLERDAEALRAAGHDVTVEVDNTWRPAAVRWEEREERADNRADRLDERAGKAADRSTAAYNGVRQISDGIPLGQPILVGHHSEGRARRDIARMDAGMRRSIEEGDYAESLASRAAGSRANEAAKHGPRAIMRKIETLETEGRRMKRHLEDSPTGAWADVTRLNVERDEEEIAYLRGILASHADAGTFAAWGPEHFQRGDFANVRGRWCEVARVNRKSVSVRNRFGWSGQSAQPAAWDEIGGRRRDGVQIDTPNGEPWPVELAQKVERFKDLAQTVKHEPRDDESRWRRWNFEWAQRLVHGLDLQASDREVAVFQAMDRTNDEARALMVRYLDVYDRLKAGEKAPDIAASLVVDRGEPAWRLPDREPEARRAGPSGWRDDTQPLVAPGDLVKGVYDGGRGGRLVRGFCGPVAHVSAVNDRRERGEWVTIRLVDGEERSLQTHQWLAVYPAGTWEHPVVDEPEAAVETSVNLNSATLNSPERMPEQAEAVRGE